MSLRLCIQVVVGWCTRTSPQLASQHAPQPTGELRAAVGQLTNPCRPPAPPHAGQQLYKEVKQASDSMLGVPSQCVVAKKASSGRGRGGKGAQQGGSLLVCRMLRAGQQHCHNRLSRLCLPTGRHRLPCPWPPPVLVRPAALVSVELGCLQPARGQPACLCPSSPCSMCSPCIGAAPTWP